MRLTNPTTEEGKKPTMTKLKVLGIIMLLVLPPLASGQVEYDSVRVAVAPGVTCPASWTASTETVTIPDRYTVRAPASIGGRSFRVTARLVNALWPTRADKATAVASGKLVNQPGSTIERHYCSLLP